MTKSIRMRLLTAQNHSLGPGQDTVRTRKSLYRCARPSSALRNGYVQTVFVARDQEAAGVTAGFGAQRCAMSDIFEKQSILGADLY